MVRMGNNRWKMERSDSWVSGVEVLVLGGRGASGVHGPPGEEENREILLEW